MIPYARQQLNDSDIAAVVEVLRSERLTQGPAIETLERAIAGYCGVRHAVAVSSGTAALHLACRALDIGPGDRVWTSPITFVASANCALYCGAEVGFVDIDPGTRNLCVATLADRLERAARDGTLPKAVVVVHFAGLSCDMAAIGALAGRYGFRVIEDAAHALGGRYRDAPVGCGRHSDLTVFSLHPVKTITSGEGGVVTTSDARLDARLRRLRSHGIERDAKAWVAEAEGGWYYELTELGYNYRITDIQAALGASQAARIDEFVAARRRLAARYDAALAGLPLRLPQCDPAAGSAHHLYVIELPGGAAQRRRVYDGLHADGIGVQVHYIPVHLQPLYRALGFGPGDFPHAEAYYAGALSLPLYPGLRDDEQQRVVSALRRRLGEG